MKKRAEKDRVKDLDVDPDQDFIRMVYVSLEDYTRETGRSMEEDLDRYLRGVDDDE